MSDQVKALLFDVFGTVVDWRSSVAAELKTTFAARGESRDWEQMAMDWRALYQPAMQAVRSGEREYVLLDVLHRENLDLLLDRHGLGGLTGVDLDHLNRVWHRLDPWPDSAEGLARLRARRIVATLSNGNIALMVGLARHGGLVWDAILGAEIAQGYKPDPKVYLRAAHALALDPAQCMMVAAHNEDLRAAHALGFRTAFVRRPTEYGPGQAVDLRAEEDWGFDVGSLTELADRMG